MPGIEYLISYTLESTQCDYILTPVPTFQRQSALALVLGYDVSPDPFLSPLPHFSHVTITKGLGPRLVSN